MRSDRTKAKREQGSKVALWYKIDNIANEDGRHAALKGTLADLSRVFFRVFGQTKMTILLGFTVAGDNLDRIRSYRVKSGPRRSEAGSAQAQTIWRDVIEPATTTGPTEIPPDT